MPGTKTDQCVHKRAASRQLDRHFVSAEMTPARKPYAAPTLIVYGSVRELTLGLGSGAPEAPFGGTGSGT